MFLCDIRITEGLHREICVNCNMYSDRFCQATLASAPRHPAALGVA